ncbi:SDR family oxidoreductase [Paraburkholderia sp. C35]|uniref:SDR family oxidoreductase n=1 Tax=Paraburkholderia sp. C35 TaxID=2126993 RepID=UPI000D695598|nr:SDR family oxidoreductase [Paraburkholderia sp. C35]
MKLDQQTKVAFVTGGNRGIGLETARQLAQAGVFTVIGSRSDEAGKAAVQQLSDEGLSISHLVFDVTNQQDHQKARDHFKTLAGRLDILINNAGVYLEGETGVNELYNAIDVPESVMRETMEANFFAPVLLTQTLLPLLQAAPAGRIVNLSSTLGSLTLHSDASSPVFNINSVAYDTSKTAINSYTVHLANVLKGTRVKVNAAHPGWVQTSMGGSAAPMSIVDGGKTSLRLALLPEDGPSGGFFHLDKQLPW